jgi:preprotein translocase subunit SecY
MPEMVRTQLAITAYFGGTSILIIVSVGMDTYNRSSHICLPTNTRDCWKKAS